MTAWASWLATNISRLSDRKLFPWGGKNETGFNPPVWMQPQRNRGGNTTLNIVEMNGNPGEWKPLFKATGNDFDNDVLTVCCRLSCESLQIDTDPAPDFLEIEGRVQWGVGGANFEALFDWHNGTQFSVFGSYCQVSARLGTQGTAPDDIVIPDAQIQAAFTPGTRAAQARPTKTLFGNFLDGNEDVFCIPDFARSFMIMADDIAAFTGAYEFQLLGAPDGQVLLTDTPATSLAIAALPNGEGVPLPERARYFRLNGAVGGPFNYSVIFPLNL